MVCTIQCSAIRAFSSKNRNILVNDIIFYKCYQGNVSLFDCLNQRMNSHSLVTH